MARFPNNSIVLTVRRLFGLDLFKCKLLIRPGPEAPLLKAELLVLVVLLHDAVECSAGPALG